MKAEELRNDIFDILKDHKIIPTFEMVSDLSQFAAKQSQLPTQEVGVSEDELQQDFKDWLGWKDKKAPDQDDPDYYTYSWGMNVWCNAYKAYKTLPTPKREDNLGWESMWSDGLSEKSAPKREDKQ